MYGVLVLNRFIISALVIVLCTAAAQAQSWTGKASYYGARGHMTCAHRSLPFGTHVRVTNLSNRRSVVLVVNDRGPFIAGRIVDVSTAAAEALGFRHAGLAKVSLETVID
jgi:rare lipoprotein A